MRARVGEHETSLVIFTVLAQAAVGIALVAAFAPFALYGPALGITTALPDSDVTRPGDMTFDDARAACAAIDATLLFASPAALANIVHTAGASAEPLSDVRLVMSAGAPIAFLMFDVDNFKQYNDTNGHPAGDVVLKQLAAILKENVRAADIVARYGGEEFCVVLPAVDEVRAAECVVLDHDQVTTLPARRLGRAQEVVAFHGVEVHEPAEQHGLARV